MGKIEELQRQSDDMFEAVLSRNEKDAVAYYTRKGYEEINGALNGDVVMTKSIETKIRQIDSAIKKFGSLSDDIIAHRVSWVEFYADWNVGDVRDLKGFTSTTLKKSYADELLESRNAMLPNSNMLIEINMPKGTRGMFIGKNTSYGKSKANPQPSAKETEYLLGRGMKFRVIEHTDLYLRLEVVND